MEKAGKRERESATGWLRGKAFAAVCTSTDE